MLLDFGLVFDIFLEIYEQAKTRTIDKSYIYIYIYKPFYPKSLGIRVYCNIRIIKIEIIDHIQAAYLF